MELQVARRLPEEFLELPGSPSQRALLIVYRYWPAYSETEQDDLAKSLHGILEPLLHGSQPTVTDSMRDDLERAVQSWEKQVWASDPDRQKRVFQIGMSPPRQVRFVNATFTPLQGTGYGARVTLDRAPGEWCLGFAQCPTQDKHLHCVAAATLDALRQAIPEKGLRFELTDAGAFETLGHTGILVSLAIHYGDKSWSLIGLCAGEGRDVHHTTALAVLNGTNRLLRTG
jgi:hypothetical protein